MAEYRLYGEPNCNLFSIIGSGEVDQSKSLGLVLSKSDAALNALVNLAQPQNGKIKTDKTDRVIIDCEMRQDLGNLESYRADVVVRAYNKQGLPKYAIIIETKRKGARISEEDAINQVTCYKQTFEELKNFNVVTLVTLTDIRTIFSNQATSSNSVVSITWGELITKFETINDSIVTEYIKYLLKINGNMKQYDKEVLSIPAGNSYDHINKSGIYCCPVVNKGPYKRRAESHPLYLAFRQRGSVIKELFKIKDIIQIYRPIKENNNVSYSKDDGIRIYLEKTYGKEFVNCFEKHWSLNQGEEEYSYVFIFDKEETIDLPKPIKLRNGNAYSKELTLKQVFCPDNIITQFI